MVFVEASRFEATRSARKIAIGDALSLDVGSRAVTLAVSPIKPLLVAYILAESRPAVWGSPHIRNSDR